MEKANNYQCPTCGGALAFSPKSGTICCKSCGNEYSVEEIESLYKKQEKVEDSVSGEWDASFGGEWGADGENMREYSCPSCGAAILCDKTTAATKCPYCDNPSIIETQFSGSLKPNYVLPFKIDKKDAIAHLKSFYSGKKFLPKCFSDENHLEEVRGIYVPFWFFSGKSEGSAVFSASKSYSTRSGNVEKITTKHYDCFRAGNLEFKLVPADASKKMPDDLMDSLEPFDYSQLKDFSTAYLPGYLADKYDVSSEECIKRADKRCATTFVNYLQKTVKGFEGVSLKQKNIVFKSGSIKYGLIPVYLLYTKYEGERRLFAVNGQTGKVAGTLPLGKREAFLFVVRSAIFSLIIDAAIIALALKFVF